MKSLRRDYVAVFRGAERDQKVNHPLLAKRRHFREQGWLSLETGKGAIWWGGLETGGHIRRAGSTATTGWDPFCAKPKDSSAAMPPNSPHQSGWGDPHSPILYREAVELKHLQEVIYDPTWQCRDWNLGIPPSKDLCVCLVMPCYDIWYYETECLPRGEMTPSCSACVLCTVNLIWIGFLF